MREIKFRAWDKGNKAYIYPTEKNGGNVLNAWIDSESDVSIIEQFTGLRDKNGVEIYEGDKIKAPYTNKPLIVEYRKGKYEPFDSSGEYGPMAEYVEVVGTIHEEIP